jgi:hypothetical protein
MTHNLFHLLPIAYRLQAKSIDSVNVFLYIMRAVLDGGVRYKQVS